MSSTASPSVFTDCPYWGKGGRFIFDLASGQRMRVAAAPATPPGETVSGAADQSPAEQPSTNHKLKEKNRG